MDKRILSILQVVAKEQLDDECGACIFCDGEYIPYACRSTPSVDYIAHKPDCPTLLARDLLQEYGQPLQIYKVTYTILQGKRHDIEDTKAFFAVGFSAEEVTAGMNTSKCGNVQATYVRDV